MAGKILTARLALRHAAKLLDEGHPAATAHCALAKKIATDQGKNVTTFQIISIMNIFFFFVTIRI